ncbi:MULTISPECIES: ABC transporter ATP-binding protein [Bacillus]|uniref:Peptide ABC transporter ATP-binding protein n=1 Tax=Bacillus wiedmannii TaxID=1890302 RepID=A0A2C4MJ24_9BACI|nr:ABC transporter ATP-binding protein [Bacillus wiedmannii]MCU5707984.1 ABC transporter ATP-binding protein [Bacillus wiedmannii]PEJ45131.1 peptide ABC transporter ATP-binding protein [Bacillus wiedmannii]PEM09964.1 peptide ABC transporter ATP-binding protein [Bacillus wiedmannii]PEM99541.1 peptide ABC transporter ATP-binding protein [Bacillus wiedmannii]PFZ30779.1 peptide ABC transporter ATP-binding protein [Bacillus wiedmannii]
MSLVVLKDIKKVYSNKNHNTFALNGINLTINKGEIIAIMGRSGSGKSTLLNVIGLIDMPDEGEYTLNEKTLTEIRANQVHKTRNEMIGFVFQYFALLKEHTVLDNVALPLTYRKLKQRERENKAKFYLEKVGLKEQMYKTPDELSGGQQQRVAIARALVGEPELILADEPTGNLDRKTGEEIMNLLLQLNEEGRTIIIVTHDIEVANKCNRIIELVDGEVVRS